MYSVPEFNNIEDLVMALCDENTSSLRGRQLDRYPVRYLLFDTLRDLKSFLKMASGQLNAHVLNCDYIEQVTGRSKDTDTIVTSSQCLDLLRELGRTTIVPQFSEILRFIELSGAQSLLHELATMENSSNNLQRRIYLPIVGQLPKFFSFYSSFLRKRENPIPYRLVSQGEPVDVYVSSDAGLNACLSWRHCIQSVGEWYRCVELDDEEGNLWLCKSKTISALFHQNHSDLAIRFHTRLTAYSLLKTIFKMTITTEYDIEDDCFWRGLLKKYADCSSDLSIVDFIQSTFQYRTIDPSNVIKCWIEADTSFKRWLIRLLVLESFAFHGSYIRQIIGTVDVSSQSDLYCQIYTSAITHFVDFSAEQLEERKEYVRQFTSIPFPHCVYEKLYQVIVAHKDVYIQNSRLLYCDVFDFEKEALMKILTDDPDAKNISQLIEYCADVKMYLNTAGEEAIPPVPEWLPGYLQEYRTSKLKNQYSENLSGMLQRVNGSEDAFYSWWFGLPQSSIAAKADTENRQGCKQVWVDGLGIEWVPFVCSYVKSKWPDVCVKYRVARTELPSTTEFNKYEFPRVESLDSLFHDKVYSFPNVFLLEIKEVKKILEALVFQIPKNETLLVYSDHGATVMSTKVPSLKQFCETAEHEGRCARIDVNSMNPCDDYLVERSRGYAVALKHRSLSTKPIHESHGGATPEECIVPILELSKKEKAVLVKETLKEGINMGLIYEAPVIDPSIDIEIELTDRDIDSVRVSVRGKVYQPVHVEMSDRSMRVKFCFDGLRPGTYDCIFAMGGKEQEFKLIIKSGFEEEDLF